MKRKVENIQYTRVVCHAARGQIGVVCHAVRGQIGGGSPRREDDAGAGHGCQLEQLEQ